MDVADLASQLTLFEHSFVRLMTPRALLAWDTEYLELIEVSELTVEAAPHICTEPYSYAGVWRRIAAVSTHAQEHAGHVRVASRGSAAARGGACVAVAWLGASSTRLGGHWYVVGLVRVLPALICSILFCKTRRIIVAS